jgi:hypothetical protein
VNGGDTANIETMAWTQGYVTIPHLFAFASITLEHARKGIDGANKEAKSSLLTPKTQQ